MAETGNSYEWIVALIEGYTSGMLSVEAKAKLDAWIAERQENKVLFNELTNADAVAKELTLLKRFDAQARLMEFEQKHMTVPSRPTGGKAIKLFTAKWIGALAAAVAVIIFGIWLFKGFEMGLVPRNDDVAYKNDVAPGKNGATITLANGKVIALSGNKKGVVVGISDITYNDGTSLSTSSPANSSSTTSSPTTSSPTNSSLRGGTTKQTPGEVAPTQNAARNDEPVGTLTASTAKGQNYQFTLPDGTRVWLNADSKIRFPSQFNGKERKIILFGEGYFEVAKDKNHPFIVETDQQSVEVLGTHFNINNYPDEGRTRTTLLEGSVKVRANQTSEVVLKPNQQAILQAGAIKVSPANIEQVTAWKNGYFRFNGEQISSIMLQLARWYDIQVKYEGKVTEEGLYGKISRYKNISEVLKMLEKTGLVRFKVEGKEVTVLK